MTNDTSANSVAKNFQAGDKLAGCYNLKQILPFEGAGVVWLVHDEELNKDLTLYFLPDTVVADARAMSEIKQEVKRNRQIVHPRILRVHDLIEENNWAAITMDHVDGETVASLRQKKEKGAFDVSEIAAWITQLCQTLEDAHKIDLLHRDLAPENLLVTKSGALTVMNFGISRAVLDSLSRSGQKVHGDGNLSYMSPQQLDGERVNKWDDVYSLGAVIYDLLTSQPPFYKGELISQIRKALPPPISERRRELGISGEPVPKAWDKAVAACLEKHTAQRPKSAQEFANILGSEKLSPAKPEPATPGPEPIPPVITEEPGTAAHDPGATKKSWGPSKTPVVTEATVVSHTSVPKTSEPASSDVPVSSEDLAREEAVEKSNAGDRRGGPTTPSGFPLRAFVGVEGGRDAKPKSKIPASALAVAAVVVIIGLAAYLMTSGPEKKEEGFTQGVTQLEPAQNVSTQQVIDKPVKSTGSMVMPSAAPRSDEKSVPAPMKSEPAMIVVKNNATPKPASATPTPAATPVPMAASPTPAGAIQPVEGGSSLAHATQVAAEKTKAAESARLQLLALQQAMAEKAKTQQAAQSGLKEAQDAIQQKLAAASAAKKTADDAAAAQKQREEAQKKADAEAEAAQKSAADKARVAADARKAATDNLQTVKQQQALAQRADAEAQELQRMLAERQRAAAEAAKVSTDGDGARKQAELAVKQAESDAVGAQAEVERLRLAEQTGKAAEEAQKMRLAREAELKRISEQAAVAAKAAAQAQKALQEAQRQFDEAEKARVRAVQDAAAAARGPSIPASSPSASAAHPEMSVAAATPMAAKVPSLTVGVPKAHLDETLENSLGMKFASVGGVLFSVWQTRVQDYNAFAKATGVKSSAWMQPGFKQGPDHPVVNVSWVDAVAFCRWLTDKEHKEGLLAANQAYRLPTDAEWSKGVGLPDESGRTAELRDMDVPDQYPWGTQWPPPKGAGNYTGEETGSDVAIKGYDDGFAWTSPVGTFPPNKAGLYDMGGNVWQWCMDWWNDEHQHKVLRGGSWYNGALKLSLLSACRVHAAPDSYTDNYGFRVVVAAAENAHGSRR